MKKPNSILNSLLRPGIRARTVVKLAFHEVILFSAIFAFVGCTTQAPTEGGEESEAGLISLSIGEVGTTTGEYRGRPFTVIAEFAESTAIGEVEWTCGADVKQVFQEPRKRVLRLEREFGYREKLPANLDSGSLRRFDTLRVKVGNTTSNQCRIWVTNLAPIIRRAGIQVHDGVLVVRDTAIDTEQKAYGELLFGYTIDTICSHLTIELDVYDPPNNRDPVTTDWIAGDTNRLFFRTQDSRDNSVTYRVPSVNFMDTIIAESSDNAGGSRRLTLVVSRFNGTNSISIDTVRFGNVRLPDTSDAYQIEAVVFDSARIRMVTSDEGVSAGWRANHGTFRMIDSADGLDVMYTCTNPDAGDTLKLDMRPLLDSIVVTFTNSIQDALTKTIRIVRVPTNRNPVVQAVVVNERSYTGSIPYVPVQVVAGSTVLLDAVVRDPDGADDPLTGRWESRLREQVLSVDFEAAYACLDSSYTDTLVFTAADELGFEVSKMVILESNRKPVLDSLGIGDTVFESTAKAGTRHLTVGDSLDLTIFGHDPEEEDVLIVVRSPRSGAVVPLETGVFRYRSSGEKTYLDTVVIRISDGVPHTVLDTVMIAVDNRHPQIDSIVAGGINLVRAGNSFSHTMTTLSNVTFALHTSDPDGENPFVSWEKADSSSGGVLSKTTRQSGQYQSMDSFYTDTVRIVVEDRRGGLSTGHLLIKVDNRAPAITEIAAGDTVFTFSESTPDEVTRLTNREEEFTMTVTVEDPNDTYSAFWRRSESPDTKEHEAFELPYRAVNESVVDTVTVRVEDSRGSMDIKTVLIQVK